MRGILIDLTFILCVVFFASSGYAQDAKDTLIIKAARPQAELPLYFFGGQDIELPVTIRGNLDDFQDIQARMIQLSSSLEVPHGDPISVELAGVPPVSCEYDYVLNLSLPAVKRETLFVIRFTARGADEEKRRNVAEVHLVLYPGEFFKDMESWAQRTVLRVKDPGGRLTKLLESKKIAFEDFRSPVIPSAGQAVVNVVTTTASENFRKEDYVKPGQTTIFFYEKESGVPYIRVSTEGDSRVVEVYIKLLDALRDDPKAQKTFLDIIRLSESPESF